MTDARGGKVVAQLVNNVTGKTILDFIKKFFKTDDTELHTDQYKGYSEAADAVKTHETLDRSVKWEEGAVHTNTIKRFWSFVKRAWFSKIFQVQND